MVHWPSRVLMVLDAGAAMVARCIFLGIYVGFVKASRCV
jgi:hypothetical protein